MMNFNVTQGLMPRLTAAAAATLCASAISCAPLAAQIPIYAPLGNSCPGPDGQRLTVEGALPVPGLPMSIKVAGGQQGQPGALLFAPLGSFAGLDLGFLGMSGCRLHVDPFSAFSVPLAFDHTGDAEFEFLIPLSTVHGTEFYNQAFGIGTGPSGTGLMVSHAMYGRHGYEPRLTPEQIAEFAPVVRIHPGEDYFPMDPLDFIEISRFRHHRTLNFDQGYNWVTQSWHTNNSTHSNYYDIPVGLINGYGPHANGKNRRPRDGNSGSSWNVFLDAQGNPGGDHTPDHDVPTYYHYRQNGLVHEIQYWWFSGFNDAFGPLNHEGDWEHVTIHVKAGEVIGGFYAGHNGGHNYDRDEISFSGSHPVVYMAKGTHASYNRPGSHHILGTDQAANGGYQWDTRFNLQRLAVQPWRDFAGAWGNVGEFATTTGPLGPWHKRNNP